MKHKLMKIFVIMACSLLLAGFIQKTGVTQNCETKGFIRVIENAQKIEAAKVTRSGISEERIELTSDEVQSLKTLLLNENNYITDRKKLCMFIPEVAFLFEGKSGLTLLVGIRCGQMKVQLGNTEELLEIDPMASKLNELSKIIFGRE